jgi:D-3-phosphoglycerate dehydrogenase / 2-oxoglutarate reductase
MSRTPLVVVGGTIHPDGITLLESEARVVVTAELTEAGLLSVAREADGILFIMKPACTRSLMKACASLKVVGRFGVGLDTVDLPAATELGIAVVHAPGSNSDSVAEHAMMLILAAVKNAVVVDRRTRKSDWSEARWSGNFEVKGKTLGIVGVGNIGRRVARMAAAFGMRVVGFDPYVSAPELAARGVEPMASLDALLGQADVITCHTPHTAETHHMIGAAAVARMKDGVVFVNTSRGKVQDEAALLAGLESGKIARAGLDVFEDEPVSSDSPLLQRDDVIVSSHIAGVTPESIRNISMQVAGEMLRVLRGERPTVLGNPDLWPRLGHLVPATR